MALDAGDPFILTPIDNILPRYHVSKLFFFPLYESVGTRDAVHALRIGLEKTVQAFPLLMGTVQELEPASDQEQRGRLCVSGPWQALSDMFSVQDFTHNDALEYSSLRVEAFPIHKLDSAILLPQDTTTKRNARSVMLVKVTMIKGGLIVAHSISHGFMDGGGMVVIAKMWAAFCKGEDGTKYLTEAMLDRSRLMHGMPGSGVVDFPELTQTSEAQPMENATVAKTQETTYEIFFFSRGKLAELKEMASFIEKHDTRSSDWISTSDALCALIIHCIKATRDGQTSLTLGLAMDFRSYLDPPLPADYIGNAVHMLNISIPQSNQEEDVQNAVAKTAHLIRHNLQGINDNYIQRAIGALNFSNVQDISHVFHTRVCPNGGQFLTITSWARQALYELDWGAAVGTRIERVRVCKFQYPSLVLIAPMLNGPDFGEGEEEGGIEVVFGLEDREMKRLKGDVLFERFASWHGK